ncbi:MAG TPA: CBS domain-containing protein [Terriglobales bacterium]
MTENPTVLPANASVQDAAIRMRDQDIGDIIVEKDGALYGMVTDRDVVVRVIAEGKDARTTDLESICSRDLVTLAPEDSVKDASQVMEENAVRRLPVVEGGRNGKVIGIVSLGDIAVEKKPKSALGKISAAAANT